MSAEIDNDHVNFLTDIMFARSRGNLNHYAQRIYRDCIRDVLLEWKHENPMYIIRRFDRDEELIDSVLNVLETKLPNFRALRLKSTSNNNTNKSNNQNDIWEIITTESFREKIWGSLKKSKRMHTQRDMQHIHLSELFDEKIDKKTSKKKRKGTIFEDISRIRKEKYGWIKTIKQDNGKMVVKANVQTNKKQKVNNINNSVEKRKKSNKKYVKKKEKSRPKNQESIAQINNRHSNTRRTNPPRKAKNFASSIETNHIDVNDSNSDDFNSSVSKYDLSDGTSIENSDEENNNYDNNDMQHDKSDEEMEINVNNSNMEKSYVSRQFEQDNKVSDEFVDDTDNNIFDDDKSTDNSDKDKEGCLNDKNHSVTDHHDHDNEISMESADETDNNIFKDDTSTANSDKDKEDKEDDHNDKNNSVTDHHDNDNEISMESTDENNKVNDQADNELCGTDSKDPMQSNTESSQELPIVYKGINTLINRKVEEDTAYIDRINTSMYGSKGNRILADEPKFHSDHNFEMDSTWTLKRLVKRLGLKQADVNGDGNCLVGAIIAHVNDIEETNYNMFDPSNIIQFRKWIVTQFMSTQCCFDLLEYQCCSGTRHNVLCEYHETPYTYWYNPKKTNHYILSESGKEYINEIFWFDCSVLPYMAKALKKSILLFNSVQEKTKKGYRWSNKGTWSYYHYDERYPNVLPCLMVYCNPYLKER